MSVGIETVWIGNTVYPDVPVWRVRYAGRPAAGPFFFLAAFPDGRPPAACGVARMRVARRRPSPGARDVFRRADASCTDRLGRRLRITFLLSDNTVCCSMSFGRGCRGLAGECRDASPPAFSEGAAFPGPGAPGAAAPRLFFTPAGTLAVCRRRPFSLLARFYDAPGRLAVDRLPLLPPSPAPLRVRTGAEGVSRLFDTLPFLAGPPPPVEFADALTPSYRAAFLRMPAWMRRGPDDRWMMRGMPGDFAVFACRTGAAWSIAAVSAAAKVLTFRLEDLWLRTPAALRPGRVDIAIRRDPNAKEPADPPVVAERFRGLPAGIRVVLDVSGGGGCVIDVTPAGPPQAPACP